MQEQWYEAWFDSPYYHILYAHRDEKEAQFFIEKLTRRVSIPKGSAVLDAACGKGRHSITLAGLGYKVTGIDLSPNNIEAAKKYESKSLHFEVWDIRRPYRSGYFDVVMNLFSSFGYFDNDQDDADVINAFAESLKPGGALILDYLNPEYAVKQIKPREIIPRDGIHFQITKKLDGGFICKRIEFLTPEGDYQYEERLKLINLRQFEEMFSKAGFAMKLIFGDYDLQEFKSSSSPRLIMIAEKV